VRPCSADSSIAGGVRVYRECRSLNVTAQVGWIPRVTLFGAGDLTVDQ